MANDIRITPDVIQAFETDFYADPANLLARNAATSMGVIKAARNPEPFAQLHHTFSIQLKQGKVCNQKRSGRCWMFAAVNVMRSQIIKDLNLETFELSQTFTMFYDKLEKANWFYESIIATADKSLDSRLVSWLLTDPLSDAGQWDMLVNIIDKYGIVPKESMPETANSSDSHDMNRYLTKLLRQHAMVLREALSDGIKPGVLAKLKENMLAEVHRILTICLGTPPQTFTFEVRTKDDKFIRDCDITPLEFYRKYVKHPLNQSLSLVNAPTKTKPFNKTLTVSYLGNVVEGRPVTYLNVEINQMKKAVIKQLKAGRPVWFGCDVEQDMIRDEGLLDTRALDMHNLFEVGFYQEKGERLDYGESLMTHAMTFQGVNLDDNGKPLSWRVENSWGDKSCEKGYYVMSDEWFDEYVFQVVIDKKFLTKKQLELFEKKPIVLKPWDPMGSLA